ncbi:hypothetical protein C8J56DRAFT_339095 [Mycena floridula]|nr:hypothetical protein C8J56DRAFT_339095 [Mycena floridula]
MHIKGRIIGRQIVMFLPILDILNIGLAFDSDKPGAFASLTRDQQLAVDIFERIVQLAPEIFDEIEKYGVSTVASQIDAGRRAARSQDIKGVKTNIPSWRGWANGGFPSRDRSAAGFRHPQLGWFICPVAMDYSDVSIQQALRDGTKVAKPQDLCNLLYPESDGPLDVTDLLSTFLRSELLMQGGLHIFRGPSFALGRPNTAKKGNAAIHGIQSVTVAAIAYIACILRFVLSSQTSFSSGTNSNGDFASEDFYNLIIRTFSHMDDEDQDDLLIWWNEYVFASVTLMLDI